MIDDTMKQTLIWIVIVIAAFGAGTWTGMKLKDGEWKAKIFIQANPPDTTRTIETTPMPEQKKKFKAPPKITPQHQIDADSVFNAGMQHGADSVRNAFAYYTAPMWGEVHFDTVGTLAYRFEPLTRMTDFTMLPFPRRKEIIKIIDSVFVPMPSEQSWYDHWWMGAIGMGLTMYGASQL